MGFFFFKKNQWIVEQYCDAIFRHSALRCWGTGLFCWRVGRWEGVWWKETVRDWWFDRFPRLAVSLSVLTLTSGSMVTAAFSVSISPVDLGHDAGGGLQPGDWIFSALIQDPVRSPPYKQWPPTHETLPM